MLSSGGEGAGGGGGSSGAGGGGGVAAACDGVVLTRPSFLSLFITSSLCFLLVPRFCELHTLLLLRLFGSFSFLPLFCSHFQSFFSFIYRIFSSFLYIPFPLHPFAPSVLRLHTLLFLRLFGYFSFLFLFRSLFPSFFSFIYHFSFHLSSIFLHFNPINLFSSQLLLFGIEITT